MTSLPCARSARPPPTPSFPSPFPLTPPIPLPTLQPLPLLLLPPHRQPTSPLSAPLKLSLPPTDHQGPRTASPPTPTPTRATPVAFPGPSLVASAVALNTPSYPTAPGPSAPRSTTPPPRLGSSANSLPTNPNGASSTTMGN
eukprot:scaffold6869_cov102-Amphora_coffeaeformis.AAC.1